MAKLLRLLILIPLLLDPFNSGQTFAQFTSLPWQNKVDPWVLEAAAQGPAEFILMLSEQADLSAASRLDTKLEKGTYVYEQLTQTANRTQKPVLAALDAQGAENQAYWIANMIWVRGGSSIVQAMALRADIAHIYANPTVQAKLPTPITPASPEKKPGAPDTIEWNISWIRAPQVWAKGFTGQGAVIGGQDTGYDWDHPALKNKYRGWNSATSTVDHNYNWHDAIHSATDKCETGGQPEPCDYYGHGTHTMGTMVGDDGAGNRVGVAPGAKWIGCRNMDSHGNGSPQSYAECFQWFIAPTDLSGQNPRPDLAPDIINNSWYCPESEGCTDPKVLLDVVNNVRAAGIVSVQSAGNSGSECSTIRDPAAIYDSSFDVGATAYQADYMAGFSSRGPVTVDGSNRLKPNVTAPGENVRSSLPGVGFEENSGTSMAAPHVVGLVALLISAEPTLAGHVDAIERIIERSAAPVHVSNQICGGITDSHIPNNTYGWGRVDALNAVQAQYIELQKTAETNLYKPGGTIIYTLSLNYFQPISITHSVVLTDILPENTSLITATLPFTLTGNLLKWSFPSLSTEESRSVELVVQVPLTATQTITNQFYGVRSAEVPTILGIPVKTFFGRFIYLPILRR